MIRSVVAAVAIVLVTTVASAQSRPDFSGTWTMVSSFPENTSPPWRIVLEQDESSLVVDNQRHVFSGAQLSPLRPEISSRAQWTSSALVITTTTSGPRSGWEDSDIYSLNSAGRLVVVRIRAALAHHMNTSMAVYERAR